MIVCPYYQLTTLCSFYSTTKHSRVTRFNLANTLKTDHSARLVTVGGCSIYMYIVAHDLWNAHPSVLRVNPYSQTYKESEDPSVQGGLSLSGVVFSRLVV